MYSWNIKSLLDTIFESKLDLCGAIFPFSFSLSIPESVFEYRQDREFKFSDAYLNLFSTKADIHEKTIAVAKGRPQIDDGFRDQFGALKYTPISYKILVQLLLSSVYDGFEIR